MVRLPYGILLNYAKNMPRVEILKYLFFTRKSPHKRNNYIITTIYRYFLKRFY